MALQEQELDISEAKDEWIGHISGRKVDAEDFDDVVQILQDMNDSSET